jgi:L-amino acid N-acyltransferase YncA
MDDDTVEFRRATVDDWTSIWPVFHEVVASGDTYAYPPDITEAGARALWMLDGMGRRFTYVAELNGAVVGTAYLKPNQVGLGDHVANAGWMVAPEAAGRGIGRLFAEHVIDEARHLGFTGMQFNAVVATNTRAIALWKSMGFEIVGTVPDAFRHATEGPTPVHIMYRSL